MYLIGMPNICPELGFQSSVEQLRLDHSTAAQYSTTPRLLPWSLEGDATQESFLFCNEEGVVGILVELYTRYLYMYHSLLGVGLESWVLGVWFPYGAYAFILLHFLLLDTLFDTSKYIYMCVCTVHNCNCTTAQRTVECSRESNAVTLGKFWF